MREMRLFCDVCKQEITGKLKSRVFYVKFGVKNQYGIPWKEDHPDVCEKCYEYIEQEATLFLKKLGIETEEGAKKWYEWV